MPNLMSEDFPLIGRRTNDICTTDRLGTLCGRFILTEHTEPGDTDFRTGRTSRQKSPYSNAIVAALATPCTEDTEIIVHAES